MPFVTTKYGTEIYSKDWGNKSGPVVVLSHGWPLNSDNWENQMFFLANHGCRVVAHDRRGRKYPYPRGKLLPFKHESSPLLLSTPALLSDGLQTDVLANRGRAMTWTHIVTTSWP
jgi:pimeloyl-ACP methyl ester carboxylesterase